MKFLYNSLSTLIDHDEISTIWSLKENVTLLDGCTLLSTPEEDPCLAVWIESGHESPYSLNLAGLAYIISKSSPDLQEPDMLSYWTPGYFPGFTRGNEDSRCNRLSWTRTHQAIPNIQIRVTQFLTRSLGSIFTHTPLLAARCA